MKYSSMEERIGKTPLIRLTAIENAYGVKAKLFGKFECFNPTGSAKDRAALYMINGAEKQGLIKKGATIIEPTSGNTGIGLAAICAVRGYDCIIVMPDTMSKERIQLMNAYGAEVRLSDGALGMKGAIELAERLNKEIENSFIPGQFDNPDNAKAHFETTGPEIYEDMGACPDYLVAGIGTGGTITGCGEYLKSIDTNIKVIGVEPESSPLLTKGIAGAHKLQGIGANFIPTVLNRDILDDIMTVSNEDAYAMTAQIGKMTGIMCGISSGAALDATVRLGKTEENEGKSIVVIFPDSGDRYLSENLY